jgi:hypothetical protein
MTADGAPGVRKVSYEPAEPVDVVAVAGGPVAKRVAPVLVAAALLALLIVLFRNRA